MYSISKIFYWLSKTDPDLVELLPKSTRYNRLALGMAVFFTMLLAFFSGGYAVYITFNSLFIAAIIGVIYSFIIMNIDREIVSVSDKRAALLRIPLAIIIGIVVAVPLELRLLEERINKELFVLNNYENADSKIRVTETENRFIENKGKIEGEIISLRNKIDEYNRNLEAEVVGRAIQGRTGIPGRGNAYKELLIAKEDAIKMLNSYKNELSTLKNEYTADLNRNVENYEKNKIIQSYDLLSRMEALEIIMLNSTAALWMVWGLRILLILIEVLPALLKVFHEYDEYNALLESRTNINVQRVHGYANTVMSEIESEPKENPKPSLISFIRTNPLTN